MEIPNIFIDAFQSNLCSKTEAYNDVVNHRQDACPAFIDYIEAAAEANDFERADEFEATYWLCCMCAEWRETRAFRPMARLLRCDTRYLDYLLGDGITEQSHRHMASVFDGDLSVLFDVIRDESAEEFVRNGMFHALVIIGLREPDYRDAIKEFAKNFATSHFAEAPDPVWTGWAMCIGYLGLAELRPLVKHMFAAGRIDEFSMNFEEFEADLEMGQSPEEREKLSRSSYYSLWDDTLNIAMSVDKGEENYERKPPESFNKGSPQSFTKLQSRKLGRNHPCPCGSGLKYKRCCLGSERSNAAQRGLR